jgi:hypothetical protein
MNKAALSVRVFGIYLIVLGAWLLLAPNVLLRLFGMAATDEVWIRVVGMLVGFLGTYYVRAAAVRFTSFFAWTIPVRMSVLGFFGAFVLLGLAPPVLLLFALVDAAGALWTWRTLRR